MKQTLHLIQTTTRQNAKADYRKDGVTYYLADKILKDDI